MRNEPQSYPVVGQARQNLRCSLYIRKYLFMNMDKVVRRQETNQIQGARMY